MVQRVAPTRSITVVESRSLSAIEAALAVMCAVNSSQPTQKLLSASQPSDVKKERKKKTIIDGATFMRLLEKRNTFFAPDAVFYVPVESFKCKFVHVPGTLTATSLIPLDDRVRRSAGGGGASAALLSAPLPSQAPFALFLGCHRKKKNL